MTYSVFVNGPFSTGVDVSKLIRNSAGQLLAFDGKATKADIVAMCERLKPHCKVVQAFSGSNLGRLVWPVEPDFHRCNEPQCTYCNG